MKKAFTLAEVLITLVVIGIVAAITINIIFNNQEEAYRSGLKKCSSVLQQAFRKASLDNGGFIPASWGMERQEMVDKIFKANLRVAKDCGQDVCNRGKNIEIKNLTGTANYSTIESYVMYPGSVILQDGSFFYINSTAGSGSNGNITLDSIFVLVDVNGIYKKPNRLGKDVFYFQYDTRNERLNAGSQITGWQGMDICDKTSTDSSNGIGCATKLLNNEKIPR